MRTEKIKKGKQITIKVYDDLDSHVGNIVKVPSGWQYFPMATRFGSEVFPNWKDCLKSFG